MKSRDLDFVRKTVLRADVPFRWVLLLLGGVALASLRTNATLVSMLGGLWLYTLSNIALMLVFLPLSRAAWMTKSALIFSYVTDVIFISFLVYHTGGMSSDMYLLYCLLVFKAAIYYPYAHIIIIISFLFCPLYIYVLYLGSYSLFFMRERIFWFRYVLLTATIFVGMYTAWLMDRRQKQIRTLYDSLVQEKRATEERAQQIVSVNEVAKALASSLDIEQVLRLIVDILTSIFGIERCAVALIDEQDGDLTTELGLDIQEREIRALKISLGEKGETLSLTLPQRAADAEESRYRYPVRLWVPNRLHRDTTLLALPLIAKRKFMGVVYLENPSEGSGEDQMDLARSFVHFAALALENAQLYRHVDEKRKELEAILCSIGDGVVVVDSHSNLIMINPVACRIFGATASSVGQPLSALAWDEEMVAICEDAMQQDDDSSLTREIALHIAGNGREVVYEALSSPLAGELGINRGAVVILRNVTRQKELEQLQSNFVSVVSHELKTPLHSIKGFVDIILMGKTGELNETQRDFLETTQEQTRHLQNIINDLLDFTQFESGRIRLYLESVSLTELIGEVIAKMRPLADEAEITLSGDTLPDLPHVHADRTRLLQVLTNLIDNAIKFTPPRANVSIEAIDDDTQVQIRVSDTGIGVPPSERDKIFDRFYQIDSSTTRAYRGTGLGLAISKYIVEAHRGLIWMENNDPQGSVFCFTVSKHLEDEESLFFDVSSAQS